MNTKKYLQPLARKLLPVVSFANTGPEPYAVMVELHYTIVALLAVDSPWWPKYEARLTEFEARDC